MGYETNLLFVTSRKFKGFCKVEASLEMGCISYGFINDLIETIRNISLTPELKEQLKKIHKEWLKQKEFCWNSEGDYSDELKEMTEKERKKEIKKIYELERKLDSKIPFVYDGEEHCYFDVYGDFLLMTDLKTLRESIIRQNAKEISSNKNSLGYRRFDMALKMIDSFLDEKVWGKEKVKVILWGH